MMARFIRPLPVQADNRDGADAQPVSRNLFIEEPSHLGERTVCHRECTLAVNPRSSENGTEAYIAVHTCASATVTATPGRCSIGGRNDDTCVDQRGAPAAPGARAPGQAGSGLGRADHGAGRGGGRAPGRPARARAGRGGASSPRADAEAAEASRPAPEHLRPRQGVPVRRQGLRLAVPLPPRVFCDTSFFHACLDPTDTHHAHAHRLVTEATGTRVALWTTWDVISETVTLLRYRVGHASALAFVDELLPRLHLVEYGAEVRTGALDVFRRSW